MDVYIVFDRYREYSTKDATRINRQTYSSKHFELGMEIQLPSKEDTLKVSQNKVQLITLITKYIIHYIQRRDIKIHNKLLITSDYTPIEIVNGLVVKIV